MKYLVLSFSLLAGGLALAPAPVAAQQTTTAPTPTSKVERDLRTFTDWVGGQMDRAEVGARRNWPKLMASFDHQSQRLDRATDSLSAQSKREYGQQKTRYQDWAAEQQRLDAQAGQPQNAHSAQRRLLNEDVTLSRARAAEMPDLYARFIETTRAQRRQWSPTDWAAASNTLTALNTRYEQVRKELPLEDRLRIRSWQGEFRTLEKTRDVKEAVSEK